MSRDMNIDRFQQSAAAFGGDLSRWPEAERRAAAALLRSSPAARRIIDAELALDAALDRVAAPVDDACVDRTAAALAARLDACEGPRSAVVPPASLIAPRWSVGFVVAMALTGVVSGALSSPPPAAPPSAAAAITEAGLSGYYSTRFTAAWAQ